MGYDIQIGQLLKGDKVKQEQHSSAPDYCAENWLQPSYSNWSYGIGQLGLDHMIWRRLMTTHPGMARLTIEAQLEIHEAHRRFQQEEVTDAEEYELCKWYINWLKYWVDWALENCSNPVIKNW